MAKKTIQITRPMFQLDTVTILPKMGGLEVKYTIKHKQGDITTEKANKVKWPIVPHPQLMEAIERQDVCIAHVFGNNRLETISKSAELSGEEGKAFKTLKKILEKAQQEQLDRYSVIGIELYGKEKSFSCRIVANYATDQKKDEKIKTPKIVLEGSIYGFEQELAGWIDKLVEEVFCYLFENKRADPELFDQDED